MDEYWICNECGQRTKDPDNLHGICISCYGDSLEDANSNYDTWEEYDVDRREYDYIGWVETFDD